ncbi:MAG: hypothetical protein IJR32_05095 [Paludibacteraceae bacterium]|nr:hypothetical protein [Paludibacteraceae bacterium]
MKGKENIVIDPKDPIIIDKLFPIRRHPITLEDTKTIIEKHFKPKGKTFSSHQFIRKYQKTFEGKYITQLFYGINSKISVARKLKLNLGSFNAANNEIASFLKKNASALNIEYLNGSFCEDYDDITGLNYLFRRTSAEPIIISNPSSNNSDL